MTIRPRSAWNARAPKGMVPLPVQHLAGVTVHWFGSPRAVSREADVAGQLRSVQNTHMAAPRNWNDIAYNHAVDPWGRVWALRGFGVRSAANGTNAGNSTHAAVVWMAGTGDTPNDAALNSLAWLIQEYRRRGARAEVLPHRAWTGSTCPGPHLTQWIASRGYEQRTPPKEDPMTVAGWTLEQIEALARWHLAEKRQTPRPPIPAQVPQAVWDVVARWHPIFNAYAAAHPVGDKELQAKLAQVRQAVCP